MTIGADAAIIFRGTPVDVIDNSETIASGAFNSGTGTTTFTNPDDVALADAELTVTMATTSPGEYFDLYSSPDGNPDPSTSYLHKYVGSFKLGSGTAAQTVKMFDPIPLVFGSQDFWVQNKTANSTSAATCKVTVTPRTIGPHA